VDFYTAWLLASCWDWAVAKYHVAEENPLEGDSGAVINPSKGIEEAMIKKELV
jgi:hypothetical protein